MRYKIFTRGFAERLQIGWTRRNSAFFLIYLNLSKNRAEKFIPILKSSQNIIAHGLYDCTQGACKCELKLEEKLVTIVRAKSLHVVLMD